MPSKSSLQESKILLSGPYQEKFFKPRIKETNGRERTNPSYRRIPIKYTSVRNRKSCWNTTVTTVLLLWARLNDSLVKIDYVKGKIMTLQEKLCRYTYQTSD